MDVSEESWRKFWLLLAWTWLLMKTACGTAYSKMYEEPSFGPYLIVQNQLISGGGLLSKDSERNVCQVTIDGNEVFPKTTKHNIPYGKEYKVRILPGFHEIRFYWGSILIFATECFDVGAEGKIEVQDRDYLVRLYETKGNIFLNALASTLGAQTVGSVDEVEPAGTKSEFKKQANVGSSGEDVLTKQRKNPCAADLEKYCKGVPPGNALTKCINKHESKFSEECRGDSSERIRSTQSTKKRTLSDQGEPDEKLKRIKRLHEEGLISDEEYNNLRRSVLRALVE